MALCKHTVRQLGDYLENEIVAVPHVMLIDVDLSTGNLILWLADVPPALLSHQQLERCGAAHIVLQVGPADETGNFVRLQD